MSWLQTRKLPLLFVVATVLPVAALCWLGLRTLDQDRELDRRRQREGLELSAERVAVEIERDLQRIEAQLTDGGGFRFDAAGVTAPDTQAQASCISSMLNRAGFCAL